jgi:hypothetical protein
MPKTKRYTVELSLTELEAAHIALSNYTPGTDRWAQAAQTRAMLRVQKTMRRATHQHNKHGVKA